MLKHLIQPLDFTVNEFDYLFRLADNILQNPEKYRDICNGKLLASLFFEPSTRTRLSFESAMLRLGGGVIGFADAKISSTAKGESLTDTLKTVENYADIVAMRHPLEGSALLVSRAMTTMPVINAGDGGHQHPTQTLTDLMTIRHYKKNFDNLVIGICGDLKYGRTTHSLLTAMNRYNNVKFVFIAPEELRMPKEFLKQLKPGSFVETDNLEEYMQDLDVFYMTRIQKERFASIDEYNRLKGVYVLDNDKLKKAKKDMLILHPLPRVDEIATEVDSDERAIYFKQAKFGMYVRMALIMYLLNLEV